MSRQNSSGQYLEGWPLRFCSHNAKWNQRVRVTRPTKEREKQVMKNSSKKNAVKKHAVKKTIKASKKAAKSAARPRFMVFGEKSATSVVRALGKLNWKPADAIKAMGKLAPKLSATAIRNSLFVGRHGQGAAPAKLAVKELAQLKRLAA
jgi:hypothetical protein